MSNNAVESGDSGLLGGLYSGAVPNTSRQRVGIEGLVGASFSSPGVLRASVTDDGKERISPEDYSVTLDEMLYLWFLCDGPKTPEQIVDEMASDPTVSKAHHPVTVADRLAYLARDGDTAHFVKRDGERRRLIDDGQAIFC